MKSSKKASPTSLNKIKKLAEISQGLHRGMTFNITRLTILKSLCKDPKVASQFVYFLAKLSKEEMDGRRPSHIRPAKWHQHRKLVDDAILKIGDYLARRTRSRESGLRELLYRFRELQNQYEYQQWGPVRIVESSNTLVIEKALECILSSTACPFWAYHVAREYAEEYDSRYGTGLIPASRSKMDAILSFWLQYYKIEL